ncbi:Chromaffin granule amine transporter, putative [Pediculus humanus corporis]|uniref:Chromaffin granule amine transporter, putative n=1 Tax=Pediculus humanus subsp. corporis TaxID=121224 RepID=E0VZJ2_PEDHC|nr:Chromaffin granule amine transporter, putative [Pediculus humanus corporis]EEB18798.1 Chromaffin granule amine transporter, putative [Pediculus humanus corporis]
MLPKFSKRQWLTLIVFSISDFCNAICVSLQAPFYPKEAEKKGATATEYGLVFGIFELVVFIISPIYGKHLNRIGPKLLFNGGIFTVGICAILFGLLDRIQGRHSFITLSFLIRIVEAMGNAAFLTASFAIIAKEFPNNVATTFASLETFFGLGLIVGPTVGGALYQIGGYTTPFAVLGSCLFLSAIMTSFILPDHGESDVNSKGGGSLLEVLKIPGVLLAACSIVVTSVSIGFLQATLEPHLRHFNFQPVILGLMFVINGGTYALTAPCWGWLCDKKVHPKMVTVVGCVLIIFGFLLIGPAPFFSTPATIELSVIGLVGHGFGIAAQLVASFTDALRTSISQGFSNNLETYGLISGLWTSTFALGAFIGPSLGGILYDTIGFKNATMVVVTLNAFVGILVAVFISCRKHRQPYKQIPNDSEKTLIKENGNTSHLSGKSGGKPGMSNGVLIERPPGMSGLIACNSYKNRHGTWHKKESGAVLIGPYSTSYGSLESRGGFLASVA